MITLINADTMSIPLADKSVHMAACSPPYWGLRDYGLGERGIGLEATPDEYIANMVAVGREVWRVLRDDGTWWVNLGDSYANPGNRRNGQGEKRNLKTELFHGGTAHLNQRRTTGNTPGLKPKDLCGIPWRVALALQADGWYLRSDIIWAKPNPMPESVTDRPTKAHEYVFLFSKRARYFYDADAVRESNTDGTVKRLSSGPVGAIGANGKKAAIARGDAGGDYLAAAGRNRRTVWDIATQPYSGAHFATWPEALVEPMVKAGTSERGCCPECGKQWERVVEKGELVVTCERGNYDYNPIKQDGSGLVASERNVKGGHRPGMAYKNTTTGFRPTCNHDHDPIPCIVLDPFAGSGTSGVVARRLGRHFIGLDLSAEYLQLARQRLGLVALDAMESGAGIQANDDMSDLPLFGAVND